MIHKKKYSNIPPTHPEGKLFYLDPDAGGTGCHCRRDWSVYHWAPTDECFEQESPGPCATGRYFAYNASAGRTECACFKNFVPLRKEEEEEQGEGDETACVELHTRAHCPKGQLIVSGEDGRADCDCGPHVSAHFWPEDGACHQHYTRGPCAKGEQFRPHPVTGRPACILWGRTALTGGYSKKKKRRRRRR